MLLQTQEFQQLPLQENFSPRERPSKGLVYVQGRFANKQTRDLFQRNGYTPVDYLEAADIVCWTGGEDINPQLYGEKPAGSEWWSDVRDHEDIKAIKKAGKRFKVGICRGAQLLNVIPNGGTLWQDIDNHSGPHIVKDIVTEKTWKVNSVHHQGIRLTDSAELIAFTQEATQKYSFRDTWEKGRDKPDLDVEAAWYPDTKSLLVQWHPEAFYSNCESEAYFMNLMERYWCAA